MTLVPIGELTPHPKNARNGDTDAIANSLQLHGQYRSIVAQESSHRILAGHHVYFAAMELGIEELEVELLDVDDDQAERIVLVDNRSADLGVTDPEALLGLIALAGGPEGTGYTADEVDALRDAAADDDPMAGIDEAEPLAGGEGGESDPEPTGAAPAKTVLFRAGQFEFKVDVPDYLAWLNRIELDGGAAEARRRLGL